MPSSEQGVFRIRARCSHPHDAELLLGFLRRNGHFSYPVGDGIETVCVGATASAIREVLTDVLHWWDGRPEAALTVELAAAATTETETETPPRPCLSRESTSTPSTPAVPATEIACK
jgi:hypothetical protein